MRFPEAAAMIAACVVFSNPLQASAAAPPPTPTPAPSMSPAPMPAPVLPPGAASAVIVPIGPPSPSGAEGQMPYERFAEGATAQPGLFTIWRKLGQVYFEVTPQQMDRPFLLVPILSSGNGEGLFAGIDFGSILLQFHRSGSMIYTSEENPYGKARAGSAAAQAVAVSYPQSVISADPIATTNRGTGAVIFPASVFLTDILDLADALNGPATFTFGPSAHYHIDPRLSYFGETKSFPTNVDLETDLTMSSATPGSIDTVPDSRSLFLRLHYSIVELPNDGYKPRYADDRLGYFITARRQYDDEETQSSFVRYINRWNIEKRDPGARMSPAKNPIVYYISNSVPAQYRDTIRQALLTWNKAFEAIGISDAIEVKQQPSDPSWDPDDARYSVVRWVVSPGSAFAYGPSLADPLTGEIFRGDVVIDGNLVRFAADQQADLLDPTLSLTPDQRRSCRLADCDYGYGAHMQAAWAALALSMDGAFGPNGDPPKRFVDGFLFSIVLHESGHTLGLRHNFAAPTIYSHARLHDAKFTAQHGLSGSVMAYLPVNLSPHGQPQGRYFQTQLGPWDYFSIKYGYEQLPGRSPDADLPALGKLAAQTSQHDLVFATDEDDEWFDGFAVDPRVETFDLSSDPLSYVQDEFAIDKRLLATLPVRLPLRGHSYADVRRGFVVALSNLFSAADLATHFIGGEYFSRGHRGDPGNPVPFTPLPRATERRAFDLLDQFVFDDRALRFSPDLLNRLGATRFNHWESDPNASIRLDYPVEEYVEINQEFLLRQMWQPTVMERLDSMESRESSPGKSMSLADLFDWSDEGVFGDLAGGGQTVPEVHRILQQRYAALLVHVMLRPDPGTPLDASALARHHLTQLEASLDRALARGGYDEATTSNFEDIRAAVARALSASTVLPAL